MKNLFTLLFTFIIISSIFSQSVTRLEAEKIAKNFIENRHQTFSNDNLNFELSDYKNIPNENNETLIHIINFKDNGYILISGDKRSVPVLGYSFENNFDINNMAPATEFWISGYIHQLEDIIANDYIASPSIKSMWKNYTEGIFSKGEGKGVDILLTTKWNQNYPYNYYCPQHPAGPGGRVYAGCVATAMAQIMKYYNFPETGRFTHEYFWGDYIEVDFGATTYKWDEMTNTINSTSRDAIAELMFHCGVSVDMNYDYTASGSYTSNSLTALKRYFKYRSGMLYAESIDYENIDWKYLLKQDLDRHKPILYSGYSDQGDGHAFVMDAYQDTSFFHFNWGWGGYNDGFFHIDAINPQTLFPWGQAAVLNIDPYDAEYCNSLVYNQSSWTFDDGSGPNLYSKNTNCEWLIDVDGVDNILLNFTRMELLAGDSVKIYDGDNKNANLIGSFSGNYPPNNIKSSGGKMLINFVTTSNDQARGWEASYESVILSEDEYAINNISIYPNPANTFLNINTISDLESSVKLYDITGKMLYETKGQQSIRINIEEYCNGLYIIEIKNPKFNITKRILKH